MFKTFVYLLSGHTSYKQFIMCMFNTCNAVIRTHLRVLDPERKVIKCLLVFMPSPPFCENFQ
jgi:hypothetical protein